jgi:hypothetical protein
LNPLTAGTAMRLGALFRYIGYRLRTNLQSGYESEKAERAFGKDRGRGPGLIAKAV